MESACFWTTRPYHAPTKLSACFEVRRALKLFQHASMSLSGNPCWICSQRSCFERYLGLLDKICTRTRNLKFCAYFGFRTQVAYSFTFPDFIKEVSFVTLNVIWRRPERFWTLTYVSWISFQGSSKTHKNWSNLMIFRPKIPWIQFKSLLNKTRKQAKLLPQVRCTFVR